MARRLQVLMRTALGFRCLALRLFGTLGIAALLLFGLADACRSQSLIARGQFTGRQIARWRDGARLSLGGGDGLSSLRIHFRRDDGDWRLDFGCTRTEFARFARFHHHRLGATVAEILPHMA